MSGILELLEAQGIDRPSEDEFYIAIAKLCSLRSKDNQTKVGACIVKDKKILSIGYNGAPRSFPDDLVPDCCDTTKPLKDQKYPYICHAELNAVLNYGGSLNDLKGSKVYLTISPCYECAKILAQIGVSEVIYKEEYHKTYLTDISKFIFKKCGVKFRKLGDINDN